MINCLSYLRSLSKEESIRLLRCIRPDVPKSLHSRHSAQALMVTWAEADAAPLREEIERRLRFRLPMRRASVDRWMDFYTKRISQPLSPEKAMETPDVKTAVRELKKVKGWMREMGMEIPPEGPVTQ